MDARLLVCSGLKSSVWELIICYRYWKERKDLFVLCVAKWCPMMTQMVKMMVAGTTIPTKEDQNNHTFCRWEGKQIHHEKNYIFLRCNCYQQKMIIFTTTTSSSSLTPSSSSSSVTIIMDISTTTTTYKYWQLSSHFSTGNNICSQRWNLQPLFCPTTGAAGAGELKWRKRMLKDLQDAIVETDGKKGDTFWRLLSCEYI